MVDTNSAFVGDIPGNYDREMGPVIFDHMARIMAQKTAAVSPGHVLELAAGTGIVTRHLSRALDDAHVVVTDLNEPMLDIARTKFSETSNVSFQSADAQELPFADSSFDAVICQFGHMFFPDRARAYAEARRVLKPGGIYLFSTWGTNAENPYSEMVIETLSGAFESDPPGFMKVPFSLHDAAAILDEVVQAGFVEPCHECVEHASSVANFDNFALGLMLGSPAYFEVLERDGDHGEIAGDLANNMRARFGPEPSTMPLKAHFFQMMSP
ncbi:methyltransferase type 11 [Ruegeria sp. ANG-R]|uniref:class I SAM-dependent methyltransferase n=1 Tax=Ruegeria sp. ANG-R TaxID=1577903 RepID=UPI00057FBB1E|nr:class I SAM-dependent methyltransferase [Ruegeria sp. ANG-R]KIC41923.1 methyltransferase type 11 [Ruegeria sp. ANG-R]